MITTTRTNKKKLQLRWDMQREQNKICSIFMWNTNSYRNQWYYLWYIVLPCGMAGHSMYWNRNAAGLRGEQVQLCSIIVVDACYWGLCYILGLIGIYVQSDIEASFAICYATHQPRLSPAQYSPTVQNRSLRHQSSSPYVAYSNTCCYVFETLQRFILDILMFWIY